MCIYIAPVHETYTLTIRLMQLSLFACPHVTVYARPMSIFSCSIKNTLITDKVVKQKDDTDSTRTDETEQHSQQQHHKTLGSSQAQLPHHGKVSLKLDIRQTITPDPAASSYSVSPDIGSRRAVSSPPSPLFNCWGLTTGSSMYYCLKKHILCQY